MGRPADLVVRIAGTDENPDTVVRVIGDQVVDMTGATVGDVLTVQAGGVLAPSPAEGGAHPNLAAHQTLGLATAAELDAVVAAMATQVELDAVEASAVLKSLFDADSILIADADNTPSALTVAASRLVGRATAGSAIAALTAAEVLAILQLSLPDYLISEGIVEPGSNTLTADTLASTAAGGADWDATNLVVTGNVPWSGNVRLVAEAHPHQDTSRISMWGIRTASAFVDGTWRRVGFSSGGTAGRQRVVWDLATGISPGQPFEYRWAGKSDAAGNIYLGGGPDWGPIRFAAYVIP